jgi:UDP-N-acetylmuramate dehydrogenase
MHSQHRAPLPDFIRRHQPLAEKSRIRTGGRCLYYAPVTTLAELLHTIALARRQNLAFFVLGKGANVVLSDDDFTGIVITLHGEFKAVTLSPRRRIVTAGAGASLMALGRSLAGQAYTGFSYMGVIPGTVGGAVRMNAGISDAAQIQNDFLCGLALDPRTGQVLDIDADALDFQYRSSALATSPRILLRATFRLPDTQEPQPGQALSDLRQLFSLRRACQPAGPYTFGSTFKNPHGHPHAAGWYLEQVGMRGLRIGGAMVAREHANWIINVDRARSSHVKELIAIGQQRVYDAFGITLVREVVYLPDDLPAQSPLS